MKQMRVKRLAAAVLAGALLTAVTACTAEDFDAKGYVQGVLDATYHGEYAEYAEDVGESEDAVREEMEGTEMDTAREAIGASGITATDEELEEYVALIREGYQKITYQVGEAVKDDDDNFTVDVTVTPVGLLDSLSNTFQVKLEAAIAGGADEGVYMSIFNEAVKESIATAQTYDPQTVTIHVTYTESGNNRVYTVNEDDLTTLDAVATNQQ